MDRCALFVDAGYALADGAMAVHGTRRRDSVSWDHAGLLKLLAGLARDRTGMPVLRCYWYETAAEGRRTAEHDALAEMPGLKLRLVNTLPGRREGIESQLRRDLVTLAKNGAISDAFIASASEHIAEIVAEVQDLGLRVVVLHIASETGWTIPLPLRQECDDIVEISGVHLRSYVDLIKGAEPASAEPQYKAGAVTHQGLPAAALPAPAAVYQVHDAGEYRADYLAAPAHPGASSSAGQRSGASASTGAGPAMKEPSQAGAPAPMSSSAGQASAPAGQPPAPAGLPPYSAGVGYPGSMPQPPEVQNGYPAGVQQAPAAQNGTGQSAPGQHAPGQVAHDRGYQVADGQHLSHAAASTNYQNGSAGGYHSNAAPQNSAGQAGAGQNGAPQNFDGQPGAGQNGTSQAAASGSGMAGSGIQVGGGQNGPGLGIGAPNDGAGQDASGQNGTGYRLPGYPASQSGQGPNGLAQAAYQQGSAAQNGMSMPGQAPAGQPNQVPGGMVQPSYQPAQNNGARGAGVHGNFQPGPQQPDPRSRDPYGQGMPPPVPAGPDGPSMPVQAQYAFNAPETSFAPAPGQPGMGPDQSQRFGNPAGSNPGQSGVVVQPQYQMPPPAAPLPAVRSQQPVAMALPDAVKAAHAEGFTFGESVGRDAPGLWLEAVLARKPRMPSDLEARLLQGSVLPIDSLLHDEVRHSLRRGFWDALESARR